MRQFLLTNLTRESPDAPYSFRLPLQYLQDALGEIGEFPYKSGSGVHWDGKALFIKGAFPFLRRSETRVLTGLVLKGARSKYINHKNIPLIKEFFPNYKLVTLDAGHWGAYLFPLSRELAGRDAHVVPLFSLAVHAERPREFMDELVHFCK